MITGNGFTSLGKGKGSIGNYMDVITEDNCYRPYQEIINGKTEKKELRCDIAIKQVNAGVKS